MRENLRNEHVCPPKRVIAFACGCQSDLQLEIDNNISLTKYMSIESRIPSKRKTVCKCIYNGRIYTNNIFLNNIMFWNHVSLTYKSKKRQEINALTVYCK